MKNFLSRELLEVDEILFDSHQLSSQDLRWENRIEKPIQKSNIAIFGLVIFFILSVIAFRDAYLVVAKGGYYS